MQLLNPLNLATRFGFGIIALLAFQLTGCDGGGGADRLLLHQHPPTV